MGTTHHLLGNIQIHLDGGIAWVESYVTTYHRVPAGALADGFWDGRAEDYDGLAGGRYADRFERRGGRWKIDRHENLIEGRHDRRARDGALAHVPPEFRGQRGDANPSCPVVAALLDGRR